MQDRNFWILRQFLLKDPYMDLLRLTPSEFQHVGSKLKGIKAYGKELKCLESG